MSSEARQYVNSRFVELENDFESWRSHLSEIQQRLLPSHGRALSGRTEEETNDGSKKMQLIMDSLPPRALNTLSGGMQSGLTPQAAPWFRLTTADPELGKFGPVKEWIFQVEEIMRAVLARSNFYQIAPGVYKETAGFGFAAVAELFHPRTAVRFTQYTAGEYYLAINQDREVSTFARSIFMTAVNMVDEFGIDRVSSSVKTSYDTKDLATRYEVRQLIEPNDSAIVKMTDAFSKPWRSIWWQPGQVEDSKFLRVHGFDEFPILAPRWRTVSNDTYGRGPGQLLLPDIKELYQLKKDFLITIRKKNSPALTAPAGMKSEFISQLAGAVNYDSSAGQGQGLRPLHVSTVDASHLKLEIDEVKQAIREGFFNQLFMMISGSDRPATMTATEVAARHQEKLTLLGPVLENLHNDFLDPTIIRTFNILSRADMLPPPPEEVGELKIEYTSILAQAQQALGTVSLEQSVAFAGNLAGVSPDVLDNYDLDKVIRHYNDDVGTPPDIMREPEEVEQIRANRAQQAQAQQAGASIESAAGSAKLLSEADVGGNNMLSALMAGAAGGTLGQ